MTPHEMKSSLGLAIHDKVFHLALDRDEDIYKAHPPAFNKANQELARFRKCMEMCLPEHHAFLQAVERVSKCQDPDKVTDTALACFSKVFHGRATRARGRSFT